MRKFLLQNGEGAQFDLMRKDAFLCEPEGLGFGTDLSLSQVGPGWVLTQSTQQRPEPSGQMVFAGYGAYDEFTDFGDESVLEFLAFRTNVQVVVA